MLPSTHGLLDLAELARERLLLYIYPRTATPGEPPLPGWDQIPGARGCTIQSRAFRDRYDELLAHGAGVAGLSTQPLPEQREFAERERIVFPLFSDPELRLCAALDLPTFTAAGLTLYKRATVLAEARRIANVFYPVFAPEMNAAETLAWLARRASQAKGAT